VQNTFPIVIAAAAIGTALPLAPLNGQAAQVGMDRMPASSQAACDYSRLPGVVWWGTERRMTLSRFAAYAAPIYWLSPDEPTMDDRHCLDIRVPAALPFENQPDSPVVYYQYNMIGVRFDADGPGYIADSTYQGNAVIDLHNVIAINLKYIAYFPREEGLGGDRHNVEPSEFRIWVVPNTAPAVQAYGVACDQDLYLIAVQRVTGEAHGFPWYFNVLNVDDYTVFPFTLIVEEGKHAMCTDKNGDGYFTPGFDVNERVNDALGCETASARAHCSLVDTRRGWQRCDARSTGCSRRRLKTARSGGHSAQPVGMRRTTPFTSYGRSRRPRRPPATSCCSTRWPRRRRSGGRSWTKCGR